MIIVLLYLMEFFVFIVQPLSFSWNIQIRKLDYFFLCRLGRLLHTVLQNYKKHLWNNTIFTQFMVKCSTTTSTCWNGVTGWCVDSWGMRDINCTALHSMHQHLKQNSILGRYVKIWRTEHKDLSYWIFHYRYTFDDIVSHQRLQDLTYQVEGKAR